MASKKDIQDLVKVLREAGYVVTLPKRGGHYRVTGAQLRAVFLPATPSEYRGVLNCLHQLKRAGYVFSFQGKDYGESDS